LASWHEPSHVLRQTLGLCGCACALGSRSSQAARQPPPDPEAAIMTSHDITRTSRQQSPATGRISSSARPCTRALIRNTQASTECPTAPKRLRFETTHFPHTHACCVGGRNRCGWGRAAHQASIRAIRTFPAAPCFITNEKNSTHTKATKSRTEKARRSARKGHRGTEFFLAG
jgi:hypothetical protein